jgi:hypothetical protein
VFGAQGLWAGRGLYRATPVVTRSLSFSVLDLFSRVPNSFTLYDTKGDAEDLFLPGL